MSMSKYKYFEPLRIINVLYIFLIMHLVIVVAVSGQSNWRNALEIGKSFEFHFHDDQIIKGTIVAWDEATLIIKTSYGEVKTNINKIKDAHVLHASDKENIAINNLEKDAHDLPPIQDSSNKDNNQLKTQMNNQLDQVIESEKLPSQKNSTTPVASLPEKANLSTNPIKVHLNKIFTLSINGGYAGTSLENINDDTTKLAQQVIGLFGNYLQSQGSILIKYAYDVGDVTGGLYIDTTLDFKLNHAIHIGAKLAYLKPNDLTLSIEGNGSLGEYFAVDGVQTFSLISPLVMLSAKTNNELLDIGISINAGVAYGNSIENVNEKLVMPYGTDSYNVTYEADYSGMGLNLQLLGNIGFNITESITLITNFGYNYLVIPAMSSNQNVDINNDGINEVNKGDKVETLDNKIATFDFSGFMISGGIQLTF